MSIEGKVDGQAITHAFYWQSLPEVILTMNPFDNDQRRIDEICSGNRAVTADTRRLEKHLGRADKGGGAKRWKRFGLKIGHRTCPWK